MAEAACVYCLVEARHQRRTYVGYTINLAHRLRQHRGEIRGGARCTAAAGPDADWQLLYVVRGIPTRQAAMQLEWRLHRLGRQRACSREQSPVQRRLAQLRAALAMDQWTKTAPHKQEMPGVTYEVFMTV